MHVRVERSPRQGGSKQRMVDSAVQLLRERGAGGVTVDAVLAHSGAPRGSVYHHFPGGREEMVLAAVRQAGDYITARLETSMSTGDAVQAVGGFVDFWKRFLTESDYRAGCPVVALAVDSRFDTSEAVELLGSVFAAWQQALARLLSAEGCDPARATRLATLVVAAVEGAVILCRAHRQTQPLDDVLAELTPLLRQQRGIAEV